jgi:hypothetical protein
VGYPAHVWWAVRFPDAEGFRHPVVLYDALKNLLLAPMLLAIRHKHPAQGRVAAHFMFWYAFLRIPLDLFRDYPRHRLALGTGQTLNIAMAVLGLALLVRSWLKDRPPYAATAIEQEKAPMRTQRVVFAVVLLFSLSIPSNWTQDVPARYGARHPGLSHSCAYPEIDTTPRRR